MLWIGLIFGIVAVFLALVGFVEALHARWVVDRLLSLGQVLLVILGLAVGYTAARRSKGKIPRATLAGIGAGAVAGALVAGLVVLGNAVDLRRMFVNASPTLYQILSFGQPPQLGAALLIVGGAALGLGGALIPALPGAVRQPLQAGFGAVLATSVFQELILLLLQPEFLAGVRQFLFVVGSGPSLRGMGLVFAAAWTVSFLWGHTAPALRGQLQHLPHPQRTAVRLVGVALGVLALSLLPVAGGPFVSQVLVIVGLYALMGLGLNLEVGLAGLLDLGFVAFFAIGAYTVGLLTSTGPLGIAQWSFWAALPVAVLVSLIAGVILGIPVLGIRGDYLAIATLGFGEIVRLLVLSDFLRPWLGGSQGILQIPKPFIGGIELASPQHLFYVTLVGSAAVAFVAWRLENSDLGRAWMAIREDEDVAEALGINLVSVKLLAYGLGAAFAGVAGAIFAVMVGSVFPHSFQLLISINVLALIIVGGIGSTPGVALGALVLVGLPELLREFGEFRFLVYGAALVAMMLLRPEGLWPAAAVRRELRAEEAVPEQLPEPVPAASGATVTVQEPTGG
jgi:branched-chain amino acid transport system permease protein